MSDIKIAAVLSTLKKVLKNKGFTYKRLAQTLEMSESGVKKIFTAKDCSMNRLIQICNVLNISFSSLIEESKTDNYVNVQYSEKQMQFFEEHPAYFCFLSELFRCEHNLEKLMAEHKLDERSAQHYIRKLHAMDLVKLNVNGEIVVPEKHGIGRVGITQKLAKKVQQALQRDLLDRRWELPYEETDLSKELLKSVCRTQLSSGLKLTEKSAKELHKGVTGLISAFVQKSNWESSIHPEEELIEVSVLHVIAPHTPRHKIPTWKGGTI